jgi:gamma-glutamylcyclotransferase (GGCT)/AIG2-like uncharacterized protein YtfP
MDSLELHNVLFVYGALRRGGEREQFLSKEKTKFLGPATTTGALYFIGDFPGLVLDSTADQPSPQPNDRDIHGELFEIFDPLTFFDTLDMIEGCWPDQTERSLFVRKLISVKTAQGPTEAWAYILNLPNHILLRLN